VEQGISYEHVALDLPRGESRSFDLVLAAQRGDRRAFLELVQGFEATVLRVALNVTGYEEAAQQIYCGVFMDAFASIHKLNSGSSIFIWLYRILARRCLEHCRRCPHAVGTGSTGVDSWLRLRRALRSLTPIERVIFQLKQYPGLKIRTVAEILNVSPEFIIEALQRTNCKLREQLKD
jgi:RNA polymerase sigma-70 factor (ECF subfamily)